MDDRVKNKSQPALLGVVNAFDSKRSAGREFKPIPNQRLNAADTGAAIVRKVHRQPMTFFINNAIEKGAGVIPARDRVFRDDHLVVASELQFLRRSVLARVDPGNSAKPLAGGFVRVCLWI